MARRKVTTFITVLVTAVMLGMREGTGLAPPPPLIVTEEIHWLSPGLDNDPDFDFTLAAALKLPEPTDGSRPERSVTQGPTGSIRTWLARVFGSRTLLAQSGSLAGS